MRSTQALVLLALILLSGPSALSADKFANTKSPIRLCETLLKNAALNFSQKKHAEGLSLFNEALNKYASLPREGDLSDLNDLIWDTANTLLAQSETPADEAIIYKLVDVSESRLAGSQPTANANANARLMRNSISYNENDTIGHFAELHRTSDAIRLANYVIDARKKNRPNDLPARLEGLSRLKRLYVSAGESEKSLEIAKQIELLSATSSGANDTLDQAKQLPVESKRY